MDLAKLNTDSAGGNSPHVYRADPTHLVVQGSPVFDPRVPAGEVAVSISTLLVLDGLCQLRGAVSLADVSLMLEVFSSSAFRIETLDWYSVPEEAQALERFRTTGQARDPYVDEWFRLVCGHIAAGRTMRRVHLLRLPLSDYLRWELTVQQGSVEQGEDIRVVDLDLHPELADIDEDFWLFDDRVPVRMAYDSQGRLIRPERMPNGAIDHVRGWRDRAWRWRPRLRTSWPG
ncbi:MAG: DUF6879 family protein [Egibacteraceae bacterium]